MFRRILDSRSFVAALLAMATGMVLFYQAPFPDKHLFLRVIATRAPHAFLSFKYLYWLCLFSTPYMAYAGAFSIVYTFTLKLGRGVSPGRLPAYPDPRKRERLFLVLGEVHNPRKPGPSETPCWLTGSRKL